MTPEQRLVELTRLWPKLSEDQQELLLRAADDLARPITSWRLESSDIIRDDSMLKRFGDILKMHHLISLEPFRKEKFEYALERLYELGGIAASRPASSTATYDLEVDGEKWSLKSQADKKIRRDVIFISKFMEIGSHSWNRNPDSLVNVCRKVLDKLFETDRIFTLRCLNPSDSTRHEYELLEIPVDVFKRLDCTRCAISPRSRQNPPVATCAASDDKGIMFKFYFDGGTEMKLQVKDLRVDQCIEHARWNFETHVTEETII